MRLHSNSLETLEIRKAARLAGVGFTRLTEHGSRSRAQAWDLILTGSSGHRQNFGGPDEAATWDEWGITLGHLYRLDPAMVTPYYENGAHYTWTTGGRFTPDFTPACQHRRHKWEWQGLSATGAYSIAECHYRNGTGCGAVRRWMVGGRTFTDLADL